MPDSQHPLLLRTIVELYRTHWRLFWCIMLPVAVVAISLNIAPFFFVTQVVESWSRSHIGSSQPATAISSNIDAVITPSAGHENTSSRVDWVLLPVPYFRATDDEGVTWEWEIRFQFFVFTSLFLLILTYCPLSLAIARISRDLQDSDIVGDAVPLTAREMWLQTGRKALTVFNATLLFLLIVDVGSYFFLLIEWLIPSISWRFDFAFELRYILSVVPYIYFMVTLSLYNPCLILEDNSFIGIFRRSHALVSRARFRFLGIYLLTGWIVAVITSVLLGIALLVLSMFIPELAPVREALASLKFLTLFIGADVEVVLPQVLSTSATVAILIVKGLIATFLVPIWAILTTRLYLERVNVKPNAVKEAI
ncbi:MAG: hypothetical protein OXN25_08420 [Candidatus Poribacteria bacterium]|nr:hypothetical protein [Candidatus Poribacteria bacterium]MYK16908.1 hypothetical protein [Candidatus Poribacteria bacterium]